MPRFLFIIIISSASTDENSRLQKPEAKAASSRRCNVPARASTHRIAFLLSSKKKKIIGKPRNGRTGSSTNNSTDENFPIGMIVGQKASPRTCNKGSFFSCASDNALQETTAVSDDVNPPAHCPLPRRSLGLQSPFSPVSLDFLLSTSHSIGTDLPTGSCLARNIHHEYFRTAKARESMIYFLYENADKAASRPAKTRRKC